MTVFNGLVCATVNQTVPLGSCLQVGFLGSTTRLSVQCGDVKPPLIQTNVYPTSNCTGAPSESAFTRTDVCVPLSSTTSNQNAATNSSFYSSLTYLSSATCSGPPDSVQSAPLNLCTVSSGHGFETVLGNDAVASSISSIVLLAVFAAGSVAILG